jgi:hypothetical protein
MPVSTESADKSKPPSLDGLPRHGLDVQKAAYLIKKKSHHAHVPTFANLHPGRKALVSLPKPYRKYRAELNKVKSVRDTNIDTERYQYRHFDRDGRVASSPDGMLGIHVLELGSVSLRVTCTKLQTGHVIL